MRSCSRSMVRATPPYEPPEDDDLEAEVEKNIDPDGMIVGVK